MSGSFLIEWFNQLLFGHQRPTVLEPPSLLNKLICRLEADGIHWRDMIPQGGLTMFRYQIQGDLDVLLDYLDKVYLRDQVETPFPKFHTRSVIHFFNQLLAVMARRDQIQSNALALGTEEDRSILHTILSQPDVSSSFRYDSAQFWGELARGFLMHRRPLPKELAPLPSMQADDLDKTARLYDVTCQTHGTRTDPLSMHMVPASDYVNAVHWESETLLEAFLRTRPQHALSRAVQKLLIRALHQFIGGRYPSCLKQRDSSLSSFLENVKVVQDTIPEASLLGKSPPLVIDVFQRLLALSQLDDLWHTTPCREPPEQDATDLMRLTERLHLAERQNRIVLKHVSGE
ncbi:hypothetical protein AVEN_261812-1 [Araneus ventricosus]|uniref:Uncharacterized protein n=1 Tax=Araneus ventricosus TaxID=182803 RepID=A0A4Y2M004_ARAVE|nr:hypothetical protein AVEN_261812-1 [Araneus ventricosus]